MSTSPIVLSPFLAKRQSQAGAHHYGLKALFWGPPKSGKSFALASFPHPIFAIACGENGIELYLQPELGDVSVFVDDANSYEKAMEFALAHPSVASIVVDNINLGYEDWQTAWEDSLGVEEIKGGNWRKVKGPWKALHRKVMKSKKHFACSAWPRGAKYVEEEDGKTPPGVEPKKKLFMYEQDTPHVEKMILFAVDMYFKTNIDLDKRFAPTSIHTITYYGGRRPNSIPADELFTGKTWKFDAKKVGEASPYDKVIKPIIDKWSDGASELLGLDVEEGKREIAEAETAFQQQEVGRLLARMAQMTTLVEFDKVYRAEMVVALNGLTPENKALVVEAKERKKKELTK